MELSIWTVCERPTGYPDKYTVRRHVVTGEAQGPTDDVFVFDDLEAIRAIMLEKGLTRLNREPNDDPVIVEVWL